MIPWSSPRSSGWRATAWSIDAKTMPMPMPAPSDPRPMPSARPSAFPALMTLPDATSNASTVPPWLVARLDGRADVDGGERGEDERLDRDDDDDLEQVEDGRRRHRHHGHGDVAEHEDEADEDEDEHVAGEHVRVEPDAERDDAEGVRDRLEE